MVEPFETKVKQHIQHLQTQSCRQIEEETARKRIAWLAQHQPPADQQNYYGPRQAYELLFFDYMGLSPENVPVVAESETMIVWRSYNPCPTLEACKTLELDTRHICRAAYEKSTQAFISQLDPQLRFLRSYQAIRPHAEYCEEWIVRLDFAHLMTLAISEAHTSRQEGNKGYGALVVLGEQILAKAHDTAITQKDPSLHAEFSAIRQAVQSCGKPDLSGAILFATCEPCPMCASLAVWANMTAIVYGVSIAETAALGKTRITISTAEIAERSPNMLEIIGGVRADECRALYTD